jgi:hypothetical protein
MSGFGKTTMFNGLLGNRPNVFCWASDYLIWSSFWSSWQSVLLVEETRVTGENHDLLQVTESTWERTTDHGQATGKLYHLRLRGECTLFVIYKAGHDPTPYW